MMKCILIVKVMNSLMLQQIYLAFILIKKKHDVLKSSLLNNKRK